MTNNFSSLHLHSLKIFYQFFTVWIPNTVGVFKMRSYKGFRFLSVNSPELIVVRLVGLVELVG